MEIKWKNTEKVALATPGYYRLAWTEWQEGGYKVHIEKKLWNNPPDYCFGKLTRKRGLSYDVCLSKDNGWGWVRNLPDIKAVMEVIRKRQVESVNGGI